MPSPLDPFRDQLAAALAAAYDLEREITGGGMSRVFVATERALGRRVVVKVLPPELAAGVNRERFRREIQLAAQLQHPHIVPLLSAGEQDDLLWYTMPFVEGESLREVLARRGRLGVRDVVRILHDVLDALSYAHSRGVIHRDIKPANILTHGAHALVADFGVAKALSAAMPHSGTTSTGIAIGTPAYMAPEQLAADPAADHRVDLYAVGLLAYELLTGEQPFTGPSPQATLAAQLTRMPTPLADCCPDVPADLSAVIMGMLAKSPDERPPSAAAVLEQLDALTTPSGGVFAPAGPISGPTAAATPAAAAAATRPVLGIATGAPVTPVTPPVGRRWVIGAGITTAVVATILVVLGLRGVHLTDRARPADTSALAGGPPASPAVAARPSPAAAAPAVAAPAPAPARSATPATAAPTLTREDSLRIAAAVQQRVEAAARRDARTPGPDRDADSMRSALYQRMTDSLTRQAMREAMLDVARARAAAAQAGVALDPRIESIGRAFGPGAVIVGAAPRTPRPPVPGATASGPRRVALVELTDGTGQLAPLVSAVNDSLRRALAARGFVLLPDEPARRLAGVESDEEALRRAAAELDVGAVLSGTVYRRRAGEIVSQVLVRDIGRGTVRLARSSGAPDPRSPFGVVDHVLEALDAVGWRAGRAPRRVVAFGVVNRTGDPRLDAVAAALSDSLRALVRRQGVELVGDPTLLGGITSGSERRRIGAQLGAGAIVAGLLTAAGGQVVLQLDVRDMSAGVTFPPSSGAAPVGEVGRLWTAVAARAGVQLERIPWAADAPPAPPRP